MRLQMFARRTASAQNAPEAPDVTEATDATEAPGFDFDWLDSRARKLRIDSMSIRVTKFGVVISKPLATALANGAAEVRLRIGIAPDKTAIGLKPAEEGMYSFKVDSKAVRVGATALAKKLLGVGLPENTWVDVTEEGGVYIARVPAKVA